jgi:glycosyltransferase involved in cell wall biosynthesis
MASLDLLVSSSVGESFPNVLGEAMACGVPCVTTDVGDSAYVVGETGGIVLPNDVEDLASSIIKVLSLSHEKREKMGYDARKRIIDYFSLESVVHTYEELYLKMKI